MRKVEKKMTEKIIQFMLNPEREDRYINGNTEVICTTMEDQFKVRLRTIYMFLHGNAIFEAVYSPSDDKWDLYVNCMAASTHGIISRTTASRLNALMHVLNTGCSFGSYAGQTEMRFDSGESVVNGEHGFNDVGWIQVGSLSTTALEEIYSKIN